MIEALCLSGLANLVLACALMFVILRSQQNEQDLLNRIMARDYNEYDVSSSAQKKKPLRRFVTSDEQAANIEKRSIKEPIGASRS